MLKVNSFYISILEKYTTTKYIKSLETIGMANEIIEKNTQKYNVLFHFKRMLSAIEYDTIDESKSIEDLQKIVTRISLVTSGVLTLSPFIQDFKSKFSRNSFQVSCLIGGFNPLKYNFEAIFLEASLALENGADEIALVLPSRKFLEGNFEVIKNELKQLKTLCGDKRIRAIIEIEEYKNCNDVYNVTKLALESGVDSVQISTGRGKYTNLESKIFAMCDAIKETDPPKVITVTVVLACNFKTLDELLRFYTLISVKLGLRYQRKMRVISNDIIEELISQIMTD